MSNNVKFLIALGVVAVAAGGGWYVMRSHHAPAPAPVAPAAPVAAPVAPVVASDAVPSDCLLPGPAPVIPYGPTASEADMKLGRDAIQTFVVALEAYQACRDKQADKAGPEVSQRQKDIWIAQGDSAVDAAHALADTYGNQLKAYKAAHPDSK